MTFPLAPNRFSNRFAPNTDSEEKLPERKPRTDFYSIVSIEQPSLIIQDNGLFDSDLTLNCQPTIFNKRGIHLQINNKTTITGIKKIALENITLSTTSHTMTIIPNDKHRYIRVLRPNKPVTVHLHTIN